MLASQTVENYLKAIYLAQAALPRAEGDRGEVSRDLVPMGQLAAALGVHGCPAHARR
jgi:hypothetical protein